MIDYRVNNIWKVYVHILPKELSGCEFNKYYVGITSKRVTKRWSNGSGYNDNIHFCRAINKYGWSNILHEVIAENLTKEEACKMEMTLIKALNSNDGIHGYNQTSGGDGTNGFRHSQQTKEKMSEDRKGVNNAFYGKTHTDYTKNLISEHHADFKGKNSSKSVPIYQYSIDGKFICKYGSIGEVERKTGIGHQNICKVAKGKTKSAGGFIWSYEFNENMPRIKPKQTNKIKQIDHNGYIVLFDSATKAHEYTGFNTSCILNSCKTGRIYKDYFWEFA